MKTQTVKRDIGVAWNTLSDYIEFGTSANSEKVLRRALDYLTYLAFQVKDPPTHTAYLKMMRFDGCEPVIVLNRRQLARRRKAAA
jgi:hypothetical protein